MHTGIYLKFNGIAKCHWTQSEYKQLPTLRNNTSNNLSQMRHQTVHYRGHEDLWATSAMLIKPSQNHGE